MCQNSLQNVIGLENQGNLCEKTSNVEIGRFYLFFFFHCVLTRVSILFIFKSTTLAEESILGLIAREKVLLGHPSSCAKMQSVFFAPSIREGRGKNFSILKLNSTGLECLTQS